MRTLSSFGRNTPRRPRGPNPGSSLAHGGEKLILGNWFDWKAAYECSSLKKKGNSTIVPVIKPRLQNRLHELRTLSNTPKSDVQNPRFRHYLWCHTESIIRVSEPERK